MDIYKTSRANLVILIRNAATTVAEGKISGFSAEESAATATELDSLAADLDQTVALQVGLNAATSSATKLAQARELMIQQRLIRLKLRMQSIASPANEYKALGFDPPAERRRMVIPDAPARLTATRQLNGTNLLEFEGNNLPGSVTYIVEARSDPQADYAMIGTTTRQSFKHIDPVDGALYRYRVRAQAARGQKSDYSNDAAVCR